MTMYGRYYTPLSISTAQKVRLFGIKNLPLNINYMYR